MTQSEKQMDCWLSLPRDYASLGLNYVRIHRKPVPVLLERVILGAMALSRDEQRRGYQHGR